MLPYRRPNDLANGSPDLDLREHLYTTIPAALSLPLVFTAQVSRRVPILTTLCGMAMLSKTTTSTFGFNPAIRRNG